MSLVTGLGNKLEGACENLNLLGCEYFSVPQKLADIWEGSPLSLTPRWRSWHVYPKRR
jgi:hypothetical protein